MGDKYGNISLYRKYMRNFVILLSMKFLALFLFIRLAALFRLGKVASRT